MKKILTLLFTALFAVSAFGSLQGPEKQHKATHNKATHTVGKGAEKTGKGVKHGAYDVTHNKATKKTDINKGNEKYKNKEDIK